MNYAELADIRRISAESAERLVRRRRWPKQAGNDGVVRVLAPLKEAGPTSQRTTHVWPRLTGPDIRGQSRETDRPDKRTFERAFDVLSAQLEHERTRADLLQAKLDEAQASERHAAELVKHVTAAASEQRKRADDVRDEAAGLRTRLDQLQARGLWARIRNKR